MLISIKDINNQKGMSMPVHALINPKDLQEPWPETIASGMIVFDGEIINMNYGEMHITGTMTGKLQTSCDRCLKPVEVEISAPVDETLQKGSGEKTVDIEHYFYQNDEIDLGELVEANLALEWPLKVLCAEDCEGLCLQCGCIRNTTQCHCDEQAENDNPFAVLNGLLENNEEV